MYYLIIIPFNLLSTIINSLILLEVFLLNIIKLTYFIY